MDTNELFTCCRKGDLEGVRLLVELRDVDVNVRDIWDSTPLYYACLCGHPELVEYLIGVGARCAANTFDGERCLYGALTDEIRVILTKNNLISPYTIRRDVFYEFMRSVYENGEESDLTLVVNGRSFRMHRSVLAARSPYFCQMLSSKWRWKRTVVIKNDEVDAAAFECVMRFIYTGRMECTFDQTDACLKIALSCKLRHFKHVLTKAIERARFLQLEKQGRVRVTTVVIEPEDSCCAETACAAIQFDLSELAQTALPPEQRVWPTQMPFARSADVGLAALADVCFLVQGTPFLCHKMFFCARSGFFRALLRDHFNEAERQQGDDAIPTLSLQHVSPDVFAVVVTYLYCNQITADESTAMDVLEVADMFLLPGLKRQCGVLLANCLSCENVFLVHRMSRFFLLTRLEDQCVVFVARNFNQLSDAEELREVIVQDAAAVKERQETDSVTFVDELRHHMSFCNQLSDIEFARQELATLENILDDLGIEA